MSFRTLIKKYYGFCLRCSLSYPCLLSLKEGSCQAMGLPSSRVGCCEEFEDLSVDQDGAEKTGPQDGSVT